MSDFLKKLKESVETGKQNDAIKAGFNEILNKADKHAADRQAMQSLKIKYDKINEEEGKQNQQKMTAEEVAALNELAKEQERKIMDFEENLMVKSGIELINTEIAKKKEKVEKLKAELVQCDVRIEIYESNLNFLATDAVYSEKKKLIDSMIEEANG